VNSAYAKLNNDILRERQEEYTKLWNTRALPTAQICVWRALQDMLATYENLQNKGILVKNGMCVFCGIHAETNNHLFFNCVVVARIWKLCDKWAGIQFVNHSLIKEHFFSFDLVGLGRRENNIWRVVWVGIVWSIWKHRNNIIFRNQVPDIEKVFALSQVKTWAWRSLTRYRRQILLIQIGVRILFCA